MSDDAADDSGAVSDDGEERRAAFARGDYRTARALGGETGASGAMIAVFLAAAAVVVAVCSYWLLDVR